MTMADTTTHFAGLSPGVRRDDAHPRMQTGTQTKEWFAAVDNFTRVFAIKPGERVLILADPLLDTRVIDPFCIALRKKGQRWVKITYFRNLDLLETPQGRFPVELVGEIIRATARALPDDDFTLQWRDVRGSDFSIGFTRAMRNNLWDRTAHLNDNTAPVTMRGTLYPTWAVGFEKPWTDKIGCRFEGDTIVDVTGTGTGETAGILREMLVGGKLIELGCGFNPKAPRHTVYPAGSNNPGALHFGIDLAKPSDWIRRVMPDWEEPPVHMDLITLDSTVKSVIGDGNHSSGTQTLIDAGFLTALRDPAVTQAASVYGDPIALLETET